MERTSDVCANTLTDSYSTFVVVVNIPNSGLPVSGAIFVFPSPLGLNKPRMRDPNFRTLLSTGDLVFAFLSFAPSFPTSTLLVIVRIGSIFGLYHALSGGAEQRRARVVLSGRGPTGARPAGIPASRHRCPAGAAVAIDGSLLVSGRGTSSELACATADGRTDTECTDEDRKSTRLNSSHSGESRMPSSA